MLLEGRLVPDHVTQFATLLARIHRGAHERRGELAGLFDERSFFESLRVEPYYAYTADRVPAAKRFLHDLIDATRARRFTLVHGDYSPKNVLVHAGRLVLLDHEVIHWGDGAFDHGFALAHLLSKAHHLPALRGQFVAAARAFWHRYRDEVGDVPWAAAMEPWVVRHALACLLARVAGRSPLEYLSDPARRLQQRAVVSLMAEPLATVDELGRRFAERV